jgi:hypothetical protein
MIYTEILSSEMKRGSMRTLKMLGNIISIMLLLVFASVLRLFRWRSKGEKDIQSIFQQGDYGFAIVSGQDTDAEPYPYIYAKADRNARELHLGERKYLETPFLGMDGGRLYVKWRYGQKDRRVSKKSEGAEKNSDSSRPARIPVQLLET